MIDFALIRAARTETALPGWGASTYASAVPVLPENHIRPQRWCVEQTLLMAPVCRRKRSFEWTSQWEESVFKRLCAGGPISISTRLSRCALLTALALAVPTVRPTIAEAQADVPDAANLYPGRYVAVCTPAPIFGCVCTTDSPGEAFTFTRRRCKRRRQAEKSGSNAPYRPTHFEAG